MPDISDIFSAEGALARTLPGYRPRRGQIEMAQQVQAALADGGQCVLEAGTGIGKTFAYLTPIIQSGVTALISTGARALQDQLLQHDIPLLEKALGRGVSLAMLKGRANYLCRQALAQPVNETLLEEEKGGWQKIIDFAAASEDGDIRGVRGVAADSPLLQQAVSTTDSCGVQKCPHYNDCFLYKARARAKQADVVIVNHHLFLSDMRLRDEGVAELLPSRDVVLFDEAHLLPELAPQFFGEQFSSARLRRLLADAERALKEEGGGEAEAVLSYTAAARQALAPLVELSAAHAPDGKAAAAQVLAAEEWTAAAAALREKLAALARRLGDRAARAEKIAQLAQRALGEHKVLATWLAADEDGGEKEEEEKQDAAPDSEEDDPLVRWIDYHPAKNTLTLHSVPMTGRRLLARQWAQLRTVLFTSATLSINGDFGDFCERTGLRDSSAHSWPSPYDFARRSLLYLPRDLPLPDNANARAHTTAVVEAALPLIRANGGRAFVLFATLSALDAAHAQLQPLLAADGIALLRQGEAPNDELLRRFRAAPRAALLGSRSFWQGVDVRGEALSLVVVDKIPFVPPTDPLLQARDRWRKRQGENPFMRNQLPPAVILMKQVAGRLMRDYGDHGVFMIGDPRVQLKRYGKTVLDALPPMPRCHDGAKAAAFLKKFSGGGQ